MLVITTMLCYACASGPVACGCGETVTTAARAVRLGEAVPFTWQLGAGTATVDQIIWANATHSPMAREQLKLQVTVVATTGQADFDTETWAAMTADGQIVRSDEALDPTGASPDKWKRLNASEKYQGWVSFTVPYGPTEVYFTILQERLAVFTAPVEVTTTTSEIPSQADHPVGP
jgi:hypothetical protein